MHRHLRPAMVALLLLAAFVLPSVLLAPSAHAQTVVATVPVGASPFGIAYDSSKGEVFVSNSDAGTVSVISDATSTTTTTTSTATSSTTTTSTGTSSTSTTTTTSTSTTTTAVPEFNAQELILTLTAVLLAVAFLVGSDGTAPRSKGLTLLIRCR